MSTHLSFEDENAEAVDDCIVAIPQVVKHDRNVVVAGKYSWNLL